MEIEENIKNVYASSKKKKSRWGDIENGNTRTILGPREWRDISLN